MGHFKNLSLDIAQANYENSDRDSFNRFRKEREPEEDIALPELKEEITNVITINDENEIKDKVQQMEDGYFSDAIFSQLPDFFGKVIEPFEGDRRGRDIVFTSSLISTSACIPKMTCNYQGETINANLFGVILAPPANGKGNAKWGFELVNDIDNLIKNGLRDSSAQISIGKIANQENGKIYGFRIPPDTSGAALMAALKDNEELGCLMYAPEAGIIKSITDQKWGNSISEILRSVFHHEIVSSNRITGGVIEVKNPKLSLLLTGTPDDLSGFVKGLEDGFFSRNLFYKFDPIPEWKNMSSKFGSTPHKDNYSKLSKELLQIFEWYLKKGRVEFSLTKDQTVFFDERFKTAFSDVYEKYGNSALGTITRLGIITHRIAMITSAFRNYDRQFKGDKIVCEDVDFETVMSIIDTFQYHALSIIEILNGSKFGLESELREGFYNHLPSTEFTRATAISIGRKLNVPDRTIGRILHDGIGKRLKYIRFGVYAKI